MPSSVLAPIELTADERASLESWTRRRTSAQALALRARIVLLAAEGHNNSEIAERLGVARNTVAVEIEPDELDVHVVLDNSSTHKTPAIHKWLLAHPRFVLHFTPTSSSWLNLVERWFAELTNKKLRRGTHRSVRELNADIRAWIETWNDDPKPYVWTKTADQILESITRYCERINDSRH